MKQFKKGDKVKRVNGGHEGMYAGDTAVVRYQASPDHLFLEGYQLSHDPRNFELVIDEKESIKQLLKENKWWIKCNSQSELDIINLWLVEHFGYSLDIPAPKDMKYVCNDLNYTNKVLWGYTNSTPSGSEIKLEFETVIKSVQLPKTPKKTEAQLKLEDLQKIIEDAQWKVEQLKEDLGGTK